MPLIRVDPRNADIIYSASIVLMKSVDGGSHWVSFKGAPGGDDYQDLWISPEDSKRIGLAGDQGVVVTVNGGKTWSSWYNQPTAQLYHIGITPTFPYRLCSGQQESGSVCISSRGNDGEITFRDWHPVGVIEYGYVAPDPLIPTSSTVRAAMSSPKRICQRVRCKISSDPARDPRTFVRSDPTHTFFAPGSASAVLRRQSALRLEQWRRELATDQR